MSPARVSLLSFFINLMEAQNALRNGKVQKQLKMQNCGPAFCPLEFPSSVTPFICQIRNMKFTSHHIYTSLMPKIICIQKQQLYSVPKQASPLYFFITSSHFLIFQLLFYEIYCMSLSNSISFMFIESSFIKMLSFESYISDLFLRLICDSSISDIIIY